MGDGSHLSQQIALAAMTRRQRTRVDRLSRHSARRAELNPLDQRIIAPLQAVIEQDHRIDGERNRCPLPGAQLLHLRVEALAALRSPSRPALLRGGCPARQLENQKAFGPRGFAVESE
jgi:hypothetical protein